jgi:type IV secretory pathway VirB2 component (pilin)
MAERFGPDVLKMVRDVAMAVGLLAAISSLVDNSATPASDENPLAMVAQVFDGTARGLVIAVVAYVADWWLGGRLRLRIEQIEAVQDGLVALRLGPGPRPAAGTDPRTRTAGAPDARGASQPLRDPTRCEGAARHSIPKKIPLAEPAPEPDPPDEDVVGYALEEYIP